MAIKQCSNNSVINDWPKLSSSVIFNLIVLTAYNNGEETEQDSSENSPEEDIVA